MGNEPKLCATCQKFDFWPRIYRTEGQLVHAHPLEENLKLGTVRTISDRSSECVFCDFITRYCKKAITRPGYWRELEVELRHDTQGWRPSGEDGNMQQLVVTSFAICPSKYCGPTVSLIPCLVPLPSVRSFLSSQSPKSDHGERRFSGRLMESMASVELPKKWLRLCQDLHGTFCENPSWLGPNEYPTDIRLINVREMCVVKSKRDSRYICLSYVWGPATLQKTIYATRDTIADLEKPGGVQQKRLPRTLSEAIDFVRDMGELYLWIDALCIVQDDPYDMRFQIDQMDLIYARALFTIAVVTGQDCDSGIPHFYRQEREVRQPYVQLSKSMGLMLSGYKGFYETEERWAKRGWTYQELHLSRRILMICRDLIHWRCECDYWNEGFCLEPSETSTVPCETMLSVSLNISLPGARFDFRNLGNHIYFYNDERDFSNDGDALDAFYGILKRIERYSDIKFHWGLPRTNFHFFLLWTTERSGGWRDNRRRKSSCSMISGQGYLYSVKLPSWSWIGWFTRVYAVMYTEEQLQTNLIKMMPLHIDWASEWFRLNTDGTLSTLELGRSHTSHSETLPERSSRPMWVEDSIRPHEITADDGKSDTGRIVSMTSYARCRIRTCLYDDDTRKSGREPRDGLTYDLLNDTLEKLGELRASDIVVPVEEWSEETMKDEEENGRVRDLIAISTQWGEIDATYTSPVPHGYYVNLMLVQWDTVDGNVASRLGLFRMEERLWNQCSPEWKRITLA